MRMVFVENAQGEKVATALYDIYGRDTSGAGWRVRFIWIWDFYRFLRIGSTVPKGGELLKH